MKKAALISVGNELLSGQTVDTNKAFLGRAMMSISIPIVAQYTVADDTAAIAQALTRAAQDADVILVSGGLGPTDDDVTRQGLADYLGVGLKADPALMKDLEGFFALRSRRMPERNRIQAYLPEGSRAIPNSQGTAPGIHATCQDTEIYVTPGVPAEMKVMAESFIIPELLARAGHQVAVRKLKCFGAGESSLVSRLGDLMQRGRNPQINCTVDAGIITLHIIATADDADAARARVEADRLAVRKLLGDLVFGEDDTSLAQVAGESLLRQGKTLATAESCTGGLVAEWVTDIPGASRYFLQGWVTYSNQAKIEQLQVPKNVIETRGAVSAEVAAAMASGARQRADADYAISITGIAGPTGQTDSKPVGLVFIGMDSARGSAVKHYTFAGDRGMIRRRAAQTALHGLWKTLCL